MTAERRQTIRRIFEEAKRLPPAERLDFVAKASAGDPALRVEVESLLNADAQEDSDFAPPSDDAITVVLDSRQADRVTGWRIGAYEILREIGRGGMGTVYLAARADEQFSKRVAVKLLAGGKDNRSIIRRFRNERQILASLDHPNVARLLDGGTTEEHLPYFVMEYIEGQSIKDYCDTHRLSTVERLKLFRIVCSAVHYAHQNLVVHRDIKPGNILVTADGTPKLLDFGIAKLLASLAQQHELTEAGTRMLTPEYASPEQVRGEPITTSTDIYSLGVLLYELLTGHRPYRISGTSPFEVIRAVCDQEPEKPSTAVDRIETSLRADGGTQTTVTPASVSKARDVAPETLRKQLEGDLDSIVLKAMRKETQRRYASVEQFSEDIRRYLEGLPVIARKDTFTYRSSKFIRRHKTGVVAAVLILLTLIGGVVGTSWQALVARRERARAERRFNDVRKLANSFMFEIHDSITGLSGATAARELLVKRAQEYLDSLAQEASGDPNLQRELAAAYSRLGEVQGMPGRPNLGDTAGAVESFRKAVTILEALVASDPSGVKDRSNLAANYSNLNVVLGESSAEALENARKAMEIREALSAADPANNRLRADLANSYHDRGRALTDAGDFAGALESYRKMRTIYEAVVDSEPSNVLFRQSLALSCKRIGGILIRTGDMPGALESYRRALEIDEAQVAADPNNAEARLGVSFSLSDMGLILMNTGNPTAALENYRRALGIRQALSEADPKDVRLRWSLASTYKRIGWVLSQTGDTAGTVESYLKALSIQEALWSGDPTNSGARSELADTHFSIGDVYAANASRASASRDAQSLRWREARSWYKRSLDHWLDLKNRNAGDSANLQAIVDKVTQQIAKCDAALSKLQGR